MGEILRRVIARGLTGVVFAGMMVLTSPHVHASDPTETPVERRIGVFGDSLADGIWIGLQRGLRGDDRAGEIVQLSEVATGLTNYVYRDISEKTRDQLSQDDFDTAVVLFGSNDIQGIRTDHGVHRFRSTGWEDVYRQRVRDIVTQLQADGSEVFWVGLPVMRSTGYNANTVYLNAIFEEEVEALGAVFVDTRPATSDDSGEYAPYLPDARGTPRLMRDDDGIHFTLAGYTRMAAPVVAAIRDEWENPRQHTAPAEIADAAPQRPSGWIDLLINGEAYICQPVSGDEILFSSSPPDHTRE